MAMVPVLLLSSMVSSTALAFQPDADLSVGPEPGRLRRYHVATQHRLRHAPAWQAFLDGEGAGWQARFDERTGTPHRAWGPSIDLGVGPDAGEAEIEAALNAFLVRHDDLLGVPVERLALAGTRQLPVSGRWLVRFDQVVPAADDAVTGVITAGDLGLASGPVDPGVPALDEAPADWHSLGELARHQAPQVWRGGVVAHVRDGRLVMLAVDTYPDAEAVDTDPVLSAEAAIELAVAEGPVPELDHEVEGAVLLVVPLEVPGGLDHRLAWVTRTRTTELPGIWVSFVDAHTGELLNVHNQVRFVDGAVYGVHDTRTVNGDYSTSPLLDLRVSSSSDAEYTDEDGYFELDGSGLSVSSISGRYFNVRNNAGSNGSASWDDGDYTLTTDDATQAEIDSYVFLTHVHEWLELHDPDVSLATGRLTSNVNINSSCNAYYDGSSVNFYREGSGCNNTGRIGDVNYHEWGHGLHYSEANTWYVDGTLSEGAGDITAFLQTGDSRIAPYFYTSGGAIRDVSDDLVYPDDVVGESHYDGLIFAGAVWDLWEIMSEEMDADDAQYVISGLFVEALAANPDTESAYDEFIAADDDNGDLSDGTPNMCAIIEAFSLHGLGPGGFSSTLQVSHEPLANQSDTADSYAISADLVNSAPECVDVTWQGAQVVYSTDGGQTWSSTDLDMSGDSLAGAIPKQSPGTVVHYYVAADGGDQGAVTAPTGGAINPYSFYVGNLEEIWCTDFEDDDGGFTHELVSGDDQEGADDWMHGTPQGLSDDPDAAWSGENVWGNDLGGGNYNGEYQSSKHNRLTSIPIDVSGHQQVVVQFMRWLNVEDGYYDRARVLANDAVAWENHASSRSTGDEHHQDDQWALHTLVLDMGDAADLTLAWEIESDGGLEFGGWNIDDVCVYAIGEPSPGADDDTGGSSDDPGIDPPDGGEGGGSGGDLSACGCATRPGGLDGGLLGALGLAVLALVRRRRS